MSLGIRIACVGIGANEISVLKSLLVIADNKLKESVYFVDPQSADILFIDAEGENYRSLWLSRRVTYPAVKRFIAVSNANISDAERTIRFPLRISHLIEILNDAVALRSSGDASLEAAKSLTSGKLYNFIAISHGSRSMRVDCRRDSGRYCDGVLDVDLIQGRYHFSGSRENLMALCSADISSGLIDIDVRTNSDEKSGGENGRLSQLIWLACTLGATEQILEGLPARGEFGIRKWPELFLAQESDTVSRVLALLARSKAGIDRIENIIGAPRREIVAVLNACQILGVLDFGYGTSAHNVNGSVTSARVGLIAMIKSRLGL